ncbi:MAG TPA: 2-oxo acid dehydrogenase subunit E2 [Actinocrinis sp.]|nr:2-oxo acid dehydrogenase subunit E2 [Actinocrinis sp.]
MTDVVVPKLNSNDADYILVQWLVADGRQVRPNDAVAVVETSKTVEELVCDASGILQHTVVAGTRCAPGDAIGRVLAPGSDTPPPPTAPFRRTAADQAGAGLVITAPARALLERLGLGPDVFRDLDLKIVREADVRRLASARATASVPAHTLGPFQQAVARTVIRAHQSIPAAYTVVKVDVGAALDEVKRQAAALRRLVGLPDLLIAAVASLHPSFPVFFASPTDDFTARLADEPNVGVTLDIGRGLFVPVVSHVGRLTFAELVEKVTEFRHAAVKGTLRERDLAGGNITVTLHNEPDVVLAIPIVFPGQTCALALGGAQPEVALAADGTPVVRTVAHIGLAYDHRFINGRDAVQFLRAVKQAMENPAGLTGGTGPTGAPHSAPPAGAVSTE